MSRAVLLVDPDIDALGTLASSLRGLGLNVVLADDAARALERARAIATDAVLLSSAIVAATDIVARLKLEPALTDVPVFILVDAPPGQDLPSNQLPKDAPALIARRLYTLPSKSAAVVADRGDFRGDLQQVSVLDLLQLLSMNRRTGVLNVVTAAGAGEVRIADGEIVDGVYRRLEGEKALYRLLTETEGTFAFVSGTATVLRRVHVSTNALLMEALRQSDEVRQKRRRFASEDALLAVAPTIDRQTEEERRVLEAIATPRTLDELLDEVALADLAILIALERLVDEGVVRQIPRGGTRVELADPEQLTLLSALVKRFGGNGFSGPARVVLAGSTLTLGAVGHAIQRIADVSVPASSSPSAPVPSVLGTLRLAEGTELDVVGLPLLDNFSPLWTLVLPAAAVVVRVDKEDSRVLAQRCGVAGVPLLSASELLGDLDAAEPAQVAALLRLALEAASAN